MIEGHMTTTEAAQHLGYDPDYICSLCINGKLPGATKFGKVWAIPEKSIIKYPQMRTPNIRKQNELVALIHTATALKHSERTTETAAQEMETAQL